MSETIVGVDISKETFQAAKLGDKSIREEFVNKPGDFEEFGNWLERHAGQSVRVCMEATGAYGLELAMWLVDQGIETNLVNPARVRAYADSELNRNKTDKSDAACIARFCQAHDPAEWTPSDPERRTLQQLVRRVFSLEEMKAQEKNRRKQPAMSPLIATDIDEHIEQLECRLSQLWNKIEAWISQHTELQEAMDLLTSIPGVGRKTAAKLIGEIQDIDRFDSAKKLAAFAGVTPKNVQSGTSINKPASLSKMGSSRLRAALYMPAIVARRHNPIVGRFCQRLETNGKHKKSVIGAAMHKLIRLVYGVWSKRQKFEADYLEAAQNPA